MPLGGNIMLLLLPLILNIASTLAREPVLRIVGGHPVKITERPFQVLLYRKVPILVPGCGGAIINRRWILTAGHCTVDLTVDKVIIRAGSDNLADRNAAQWFDVLQIIPHEKYNDDPTTISNDIALLKVDRNIEFGPNIQPIKVRSVSPESKMEAVVSGFGVTEEGSMIMSGVLREVSLSVIDRKTCQELLAQISDSLPEMLSTKHFCAADLEGGHDACQGDSGGPLTIDGSLAGIVSWGIGCAREMVPAFYTDVAQYLSWIDDNLKKYSERQNRCKRMRLSTMYNGKL